MNGPAVLDSLRADVEHALLARDGARLGPNVRFRCVAHDDHRPSADFHVDKGVWVCRSCGVGGGVRDLARRLGLTPTGRGIGVYGGRRSIEEEVLAHEARAAAKRRPFRPLYAMADEIRALRTDAHAVHTLAHRTSEDAAATWDLLFLAAYLTTEADRLEVEQDAALVALR